MNKQIILASASPRRQQLLEQIDLEFTVHPTNFEEKSEGLSPEELAIYNATGKAQKLIPHYKNALIIGVDTVVAFQDRILGKPKNDQDAAEILRLLSNTTHQVITGISIIDSDSEKHLSTSETTFVTIDKLEEKDIAAYIASGEGQDKAGAYAIQGLGSLYVKRIEGDYFNVVGLPIYTLRKMLKKFAINIQPKAA